MTPLQALALLAGVLAALGWHALGAAPAAPLVALAGLPCYARPRWRPLATLCLGFLWAAWPLRHDAALRLPADFEARVLVAARIEGLPLRQGAAETFTAELEPLRPGTLPAAPLRAQLRWSPAPALHAGERWQLLVALQAPPAAANPGSASADWQALRARVHASGQVLASALDQRLAAATPSLDGLRERIAAAIAARVVERDAAALITALAIGDTQRMSIEQWRICNAVGITHLVAISGLHVTMFALIVAALAGALWRACPRLQPHATRHGFAALCGLAAALGYALLAGWSVPTQRTLLMLAAWHGLRIGARPRPAARSYAVGLIGVLALDALAPLQAGFWLSFLAVGALLLQGRLQAQPLSGWRGLLYTQGWIAVVLLPVTLAVFGSVSLAGLAVNLAAIPLFSLVLVPLILAATAALGVWPWLGGLLLQLAATLIGYAWPALALIADQPAALLRAAPPAWWYLLAALALAVVALPWRAWMRATAALALLPALFPAARAVAPGRLAMTVLDAGRGEAIVLRTARHTLLFDDGESWGSHGAISAARVLPALRYYGVRALDALLLPRADADRGAGVLALTAALPVRWLAAGAAHAPPPEFAPCREGLRWRWDGVDFEVLDGASCALRVSVAAHAVLLPGGATAAVQRERIAPRLAPTAVVVVPGQGSAAARQPALIAAAGARLALLSSGARAAHSRSVATTLAAWRAAGAATRVTGIDGALELSFGPGERIGLVSWRKP